MVRREGVGAGLDSEVGGGCQREEDRVGEFGDSMRSAPASSEARLSRFRGGSRASDWRGWATFLGCFEEESGVTAGRLSFPAGTGEDARGTAGGAGAFSLSTKAVVAVALFGKSSSFRVTTRVLGVVLFLGLRAPLDPTHVTPDLSFIWSTILTLPVVEPELGPAPAAVEPGLAIIDPSRSTALMPSSIGTSRRLEAVVVPSAALALAFTAFSVSSLARSAPSTRSM